MNSPAEEVLEKTEAELIIPEKNGVMEENSVLS